ncbi:hypothetical protein ACHQM5_030378 [Ranunculus cassubicifolius]
MSLFLFHGFPPISTSKSPKLIICNNFNSIKTTSIISCSIIPARDRVIDFGRHTGRMLGTLPSKYLKWIAKNLRARDSLEWAKLADEVLMDPVYKDRLEWEYAENILTGERIGRTDNSVEELLEFSQRFGWDNDDKIGWSRIDFSLLGTSKGGRIPRKKNSSKNEHFSREDSGELSARKRFSKKGGEVGSVSEKREARIERMRLKRGSKIHKLDEKRVVYEEKEEIVNRAPSPFPGREALLKKVFDGRRVL